LGNDFGWYGGLVESRDSTLVMEDNILGPIDVGASNSEVLIKDNPELSRMTLYMSTGTVENNTFISGESTYNPYNPEITIRFCNITITENTFLDVARTAITITEGPAEGTTHIYNNTLTNFITNFTGEDTQAISVWWPGGENILIEENTIANANIGIGLRGNATVHNNHIKDCETGVLIDGRYRTEPARPTIQENTFQNNNIGLHMIATNTTNSPYTDNNFTDNTECAILQQWWITVRVQEQDGTPVAGAEVTVFYKNWSLVFPDRDAGEDAVTDQNGDTRWIFGYHDYGYHYSYYLLLDGHRTCDNGTTTHYNYRILVEKDDTYAGTIIEPLSQNMHITIDIVL